MTTLNISLPESLKNYVNARVAQADYNDPSDYVRALIRHDKKKQAQERLESGFSYFEAKDLQNLGVGEAVCRFERVSGDCNIATAPLPEVDEENAETIRQSIIDQNRDSYGTPREEIEELLRQEIEEVYSPPSVPEIATPSPQKPIEIPKPPPVKKSSQQDLKPRSVVEVVQPKQLGRGGPQHKYLQGLIQRVAQERGYRATVEEQIEGGSVDVSLEKDGVKIACEVSITTPTEQELHNVQKCLAVGYETVILLTSDMKQLRKHRDQIEKELSADEIQKVKFFLPDQFIEFLDQKEALSAGGEKTIKGYKVKVNFTPVNEAERVSRRQAIAKVILLSIKRIEK